MGPFDKIKTKNQKMVFLLMAGQMDEYDHKAHFYTKSEKCSIWNDREDNKMELLNAKIATAET